jgi:hypothetical protein
MKQWIDTNMSRHGLGQKTAKMAYPVGQANRELGVEGFKGLRFGADRFRAV